jgi:hypothetical protein
MMNDRMKHMCILRSLWIHTCHNHEQVHNISQECYIVDIISHEGLLPCAKVRMDTKLINKGMKKHNPPKTKLDIHSSPWITSMKDLAFSLYIKIGEGEYVLFLVNCG